MTVSSFSSETEFLEVLSAHDALVRRCARGQIEFREFVQLYGDFWWRYAFDGHESDNAERHLLERHADRILVHRRIAEEVLGPLAPESDARKESYRHAGRIAPEQALSRLKQIASEYLQDEN